jgi:hypothetical protein
MYTEMLEKKREVYNKCSASVNEIVDSGSKLNTDENITLTTSYGICNFRQGSISNMRQTYCKPILKYTSVMQIITNKETCRIKLCF